MNPQIQNEAEENAPFIHDTWAENQEQKLDALREFLVNDNIRNNDDGATVNYNKFLYLYGARNTGKLALLQQVAQEVYGDRWESKIYLREDMGQRYPYKLHAHKVESSKRVIFVTSSRITWAKWKEMYPTMRTFQFIGVEHEPSTDGLVRIVYSEYFQKNQRRKEELKREMKDMIKEICQNLNLSDEVETVFQERILGRLRQDWSIQQSDFTSSENVEVID